MNPLMSKPWAALLGRRLVQVLAVSLLIGTLCFLMVRALPGDLAMRVAAGRYGYDLVSNAAADAVRAELGLDRPGWLALLHWWRDMATFNLGQSLVSQRSVWHEVTHHLGATLRLSAAALAIAFAVGVPLGVWAGLRPKGWVDKASWLMAVVLRALPPFLLSVLLILLVAVQWGRHSVDVVSTAKRYSLDISKVDTATRDAALRVLGKMNFDQRFQLGNA